MPRFVSLLRAINVGGRRTIRMADLRECYERLGFTNVTTYVQSGNVVFDCKSRSATLVARKLEEEIESSFGFDVAVIVITAKDLDRIIEQNPFARQARNDPTKVSVNFLACRPSDTSIKSIEDFDANDDKLVMGHTEVFLHYPNGCARTKLTNAFFERRLGVRSTARNWKTVEALNEMFKST